MDQKERSHFKGDSNEYFPLVFSQQVLHWGKIPVSLEYDEWVYGEDIFFSENEVTIDDNILTYSTRSTTFLNYLTKQPFRARKDVGYYEDENGEREDPDFIHMFGFQLSQEGKSYVRTRRKFVDDVATRGG